MNFNSDFYDKHNQPRTGITGLGLFVIAMIVLFGLCAASFIAKTKGSGKTIYTITVHNFKSDDSYLSDSIISQETNKIIFFDMIGMKRTLTSNGISVTQY